MPVPRPVYTHVEQVREVPVPTMPAMQMMPSLMTPAATLPGTFGATSHLGMQTGLLHNLEGMLQTPLLGNVPGHQYGAFAAGYAPTTTYGGYGSYGNTVAYGNTIAPATSQSPPPIA